MLKWTESCVSIGPVNVVTGFGEKITAMQHSVTGVGFIGQTIMKRKVVRNSNSFHPHTGGKAREGRWEGHTHSQLFSPLFFGLLSFR